ncbi:hypothetical protein H312_00075 [Anncaliia algerae PRA339]|uniref:Uncharacterized protein n=1 Tax=Anncaliia algerae PRA339 TaxID=1288291 RepID=A0A059F5M8_9MICR|nr:hypothetical protein H312_00075 [Anncaliia algerae PRA339]
MSIRYSRIVILIYLFREYQQANRFIVNPAHKDSTQNEIKHSIRSILGYDPSETNNCTTESGCNSISNNKERESQNKIQKDNISNEDNGIISYSSRNITDSYRNLKRSNVDILSLSSKRRKSECPYNEIFESEAQSFDSIKNNNENPHVKSSDINDFSLDLSVKKAKCTSANNINLKQIKIQNCSVLEKDEGLFCFTDVKKAHNSGSRINNDELPVYELDIGENMVENYNSLLPFKFQKSNDGNYKIYGDDIEKDKLIRYLKNVQTDHGINFTFIINCVNSNYKSLKYKSLGGFLLNLGFSEIIEISDKKYEMTLEQNDYVNDFGKIYKEFKIFERWAYATYKLKRIEETKNLGRSYKRYIDFLKRKKPNNEANIYRTHISIIFSDNYKFLFQMLSGFKLFLLIEGKMKSKKNEAILVIYLQIFLLKVEIFRFRFFTLTKNIDADLNVLHSNADFNEMVAVLSVLFQRLFIIFKHHEFIEILEYLNFILFIRAKFSEMYGKYNLDQEYKSIKISYDETSFLGTNSIGKSKIFISNNFKDSAFFKNFENEKNQFYSKNICRNKFEKK